MVKATSPLKQGLYDPQYEHDSCGLGFVVDIKGKRSRRIVEQACEVLRNLEHRGACGCEPNTGDGAGILLQIPHAFFQRAGDELGFTLPNLGQYAVGMVFLPDDDEGRQECERLFERIVLQEGQRVLGWRTVPTDDTGIGPTALASRPIVRQIFIARGQNAPDEMTFERQLYVIRKLVSKGAKRGIHERRMFYVSSLSSRTIVYKGMLTAAQLTSFYPDLRDPLVQSALAMVHSRFSTNTFPSWARAHPYRYLAHNGEINTLRGNINWTYARESKFQSRLFGADLQKTLPVIDPDGSDSAMFDNMLEMLMLAGRSLPHAIMMMVPEPFSRHESMDAERKAFYEYHSCLMEPWDGPAAIAFTDGVSIGAVLDRNGLRPSRYYVTKDDLVVLASEAGVLNIPPERVLLKGRLQPGRMLLIDTEQQRIIDDEELKHHLATEYPYRRWLDENLISLESLPAPDAGSPLKKSPLPRGEGVFQEPETPSSTLLTQQQAFGYTREELKLLLTPMAAGGNEAIGSMGTDTPLAVLSERPQLLYNYFKQLFAQVTNPPVDAIREELVMSTDTTIGPEANMLEPTPDCARQIKLSSPILTNQELEKLKHLGAAGFSGFRSITLQMLFDVSEGWHGIENAINGLCHDASRAIDNGYGIIVLSDRGITQDRAPIPALLAVSAIHHHLIREGTRTQVGFVIESGEPREVHHFALLLGYGAAAINPYLALETLRSMSREGVLDGVDAEKALGNYIKAIVKGVVKVISKMGISTIQSYCGAQVFEAIGLDQDFVDRYFTWTPSRIGGIGLDVIAEEVRMRHRQAFSDRFSEETALDGGGQYSFRQNGEYHLFNPATIHKLQQACRANSYDDFKEYSRLIDDETGKLCTLRSLMRLKSNREPIPIAEVEPVESIVKRFKTGAMSYGSISKEAHESLAIAMNRIGARSNTGEGGEDPARYFIEANGDSRNSAIKQVASGRFGVTSNYLVNAQELQIKIAQGAKPGEGGQLPGHKVYPEIARVRHSTPGVGLISPPPHHDIYSIEDLKQLIYDLKCANSHARISVKLVAEVGVGTVAAGVAKAHADVILISGHDGGTGASPQTSIKHAGVPWELGLAETHQTLVLNDLRGRVTLETDGQLKTGRDVVIAALLGAEEFGFATAPLVSLGCVMMRVCHLNTCPVGVATQDPKLRARFTGDPSHVVNFMYLIARQVRELMAELGFRTINEMVGRTDCVEIRADIDHWKAHGLDFSQIVYRPDTSESVARYCQIDQDHGLESSLDARQLLNLCKPALDAAERVEATLPIQNVDRAVGTMVGGEVTRRHGPHGLPEDTIRLHFNGSAGQSFGAFVPHGMTLTLEGDANDYFGKGLSGGKIIVYAPREATFIAEQNVIIGNVALYGATSGEAYICGAAGERFCVRNSGASAVVETVGDHGCEYMTGGRVVVLGPTGRNFAAGMSGGIAYVLDEDGEFSRRCNEEMVALTGLDDGQEIEAVKDMVFHHAEYTGSRRATEVLLAWDDWLTKFVRVIPHDYLRVLETRKEFMREGVIGEQATLAAFEANALALARAGGM
ncbi:MAG: glutamate synthase subunit alpha [Acidobacteria bacterium 13_1_40CM_3_55_6]|nr:MAG: glutamate synthase subunit alpha [Acidobacteria bacterium 13_1_40CM_3_55_6]